MLVKVVNYQRYHNLCLGVNVRVWEVYDIENIVILYWKLMKQNIFSNPWLKLFNTHAQMKTKVKISYY